jgi:hypothetical protein
MPIPLTGSSGLFPRMGVLAELLNSINQSRGTTVPSNVTAISNQYESTDQNVINNLYQSLTAYQNSASSFNSTIKSIASNTITQMVNDVSPLQNQNLSTALQAVINQMIQQSQTVNQCIISSSVTYDPDNIGNPNVVITLRDVNNLLVENCFAELATATVTVDAQSNPSRVGQETLSLQSQFSVSDTFSWMYPGGSGTSLQLQAVSGMQQNGSATNNWLMNGSFESWSPTANGLPVGWSLGTGTPGTTIIQSSSPVYDGSFALEFLSNGAENTALVQQITTANSSGSTTAQIQPNSLFLVNLWCQVSGSPTAGQIRVSLTDGTSPFADNSGTLNQFFIDLTTISNTFVPFSGSFRTPNQLPTSVFLEIKMTIPINSEFKVYFDRVSLCQPSRWYAGGPFLSVFSGNVPLIMGDSFVAQINNMYNGLFQFWFNRVFGMASLGLILPSSPSPTILDY